MHSFVFSEPPRVLYEFQIQSSYPVAQFVQLTCNVTGFPTPIIKWYRNGVSISHRGRYSLEQNNHSLKLMNSYVGDSGYYQCLAINEAGSALVTGYMKFEIKDGRAAPPTNLMVESVTSNSILVKWNSQERIFSVHWTPDGDVEESYVVENTFHEIAGLQPHTNYSIYVTAYRTIGASDPSEKVHQMTKDDVPLVNPYPSVTSLGGNSVKVMWNALTPSEARGTVMEYEVIYRIEDSPSETVQKVPGDRRELVLTGNHISLLKARHY